jgi:hypothetical protein
MEKHHVGEREPELGRRGFSEARKNDAKLAARCNSTAIKERSNSSTADSEQGSLSAGQLLDFRLQMRCSGANESALTQTKQREHRWAQTEPDF